ncbi:MAG: hypothetical protein HOD43_05755 [Candidatus Marinimicrobia bacterium]|jgi:hypothetical protein|nr:hypothetical protein [Candidatus Neomarinimicrobiota bacterium]MBT3632514.1 hypothetical protein [Candidatus Neomarinimicrobiota bacterium]MBT3824913.1 hypothetical protein [Candidatus Neomarinimicrobiota bacterium]MBT4132782.1 hypothetical protein [Candidatus Neomarinimicrobiota bacterium]MBT4295296.1 hypothetical protein [Candidatus Neomarinimicrobiota bacterium]
MKNSEPSNRIFSQLIDIVISILVTSFILGLGVKLWDEYVGLGGFLKDIMGILTISIPIPFWVAVLLGVGLSISFYRERIAYRKFFSPKK